MAPAMLDLSLPLRTSFCSQAAPKRTTSRSLFAPRLPLSRLTPRCSLATPPRAARSVSWGCDYESLESAYDLQKWLSNSGLPPQKMGIERVEVGERGLVALKNIRKGEKLLFVPPPLIITADSEWTLPEVGKVMKQNSVPDWPLLATHLISEASLDNASRWKNYISALPRQPYSLLYWTRSELDAFLVASPIRDRAIQRITDVTGTYNDMRDRIFSKHPDLFPEEIYNMETFMWSFGILFSRLNYDAYPNETWNTFPGTWVRLDDTGIAAIPSELFSTQHVWMKKMLFSTQGIARVRLPSMDEKVALVPWADMLNHNSEVETFLDFDKSSQAIVFTTDRPYQPGEQVFISYGKKSNGELLLSYGFVAKEGSNPNDSVELALSLDKSDECYKEKLEALRRYNLSESERFPLQIKGWPVEMMAYAYLVVSPPSMSQRFEEMAAAASNKNSTKSTISYPEIEEEALQFILDSFESSISKYTKYIEGQSDDLVSVNAKQANRRLLLKQLAKDLCISERRILYRTQYILRRRLRDMRSGELRALKLFSGLKKFFK